MEASYSRSRVAFPVSGLPLVVFSGVNFISYLYFTFWLIVTYSDRLERHCNLYTLYYRGPCLLEYEGELAVS